MGAGVSTTAIENDDGGTFSLSTKTTLDDIPENCISSMMMSFDPQEICTLARVNKAFHRASSADFVWESKLPPSYKFLLNKVLGEQNLGSMTKKEIYAKLCQPNFFDGGTKVSCSIIFIINLRSVVCFFLSILLFVFSIFFLFIALTTLMCSFV